MIHYMTTQGVGDAWVANELRIVGQARIPFRLHALNKSGQIYFNSSDIAALSEATSYLYPLSPLSAAIAVFAAPFRFRTRAFSAMLNAIFGQRESARTRLVGIWHFAVACHWAATLRADPPSHIHSQWIHSAGTVAMFGAWLLDVPFSFTGHAADIFRNRAALTTKIKRAEFIICISEFHRQFYLKEGARDDQLLIAYCGIDTAHFIPRRRERAEDAPVHILSAGRLVEKKGFPFLIEACRILAARGHDFRCTIGGSGPDEAHLRSLIDAAGLGDRITLTGQALKQEDIPDFMSAGDVFCLPCVWAKDNDVDGLPQLTMEAMACGLPAITTRLVGNPDLVAHERTGLLVEPHDAEGLADAIFRLSTDDRLARKLADAGRKHVMDVFDIDRCLEPLLARYRKALEAAR